MGRTWQSVIVLLGVWALAQTIVSSPAQAQLDPTFYDSTCSTLFPIVAGRVLLAIVDEPRIAASILRLHFHDCFVQGCDGSILLDGPLTEKTTLPNNNSARGFEIIDDIKAITEITCPNVVSCADILTLATFFSIVLTGGPIWTVPLGRRDSLVPAPQLTVNLPGPSFTVDRLKKAFQHQNLTTTDLVALSGAHTIGKAQCRFFSQRLDNFNGTGSPDPTLNPGLLRKLQLLCDSPDPNGGSAFVTTNLDVRTKNAFDNAYFKNLLQNKGVLQTDQELFSSDGETRALVQKYALHQSRFFADFTRSIIKMGNLNVLTGSEGEIRKDCRFPNSGSSKNVVKLPSEDTHGQFSPKEIDARAQQVFEEKVISAIDKAVTDLLEGRLANSRWTIEETETTSPYMSM